jgi:hypothetical protein
MDQANPVPSLQHIFVSYARADSEAVDAIVGRLKRDGFDLWIDRGSITVGEQWGTEIVEAIDKAYAFLLMLSPSAVASKYVHDEVYVAYKGPRDLLYVPVLLKPVEIVGDLSLPLARVQYIEYFRDAEATYAELVKVLGSRKPKPTSAIRAVGLILQGLNRFNFSAEKREQLLDAIADFTETPRAELEITKSIDMSGHIVVKMPADAAYQLKTAALNCDVRLVDYGIKGLRLIGDRSFIWVRSGRFAPLRPANFGGGGLIGGLVFIIALVLAALLLPQNAPPIEFTATPSLTATNTFTPTPTPSYTPTKTPTPTATATGTSTSMITPSPMPSTPRFGFVQNSFCRRGPSTTYHILTAIPAGDTVDIVGRNADNTWYRVFWQKYGVTCWVPASTGETIGDPDEVSVVFASTITAVPTNPPTTVPTNLPTSTPTNTPTPVPTECPPEICVQGF